MGSSLNMTSFSVQIYILNQKRGRTVRCGEVALRSSFDVGDDTRFSTHKTTGNALASPILEYRVSH